MRKAVIWLLIAGLLILNAVPHNVIIATAFAGSDYNQFGQNDNNTVNGTQYMQSVVNKIMLLIGIVAGAVVAVYWIVFVAIPMFSRDPQTKAQAKEHIKDATIATIIIAMAAGGIIWALARWIAGP